MKKIAILFGLFISHGVLANPLSSSLWHDVQVNPDNNSSQLKALLGHTVKQPLKRRTLTLNKQQLRELLTNKVTPFSSQKKKATLSSQQDNYQAEINLPLPDGEFVLLKVYDSPILSPAIAEQYPDIKTWRVQGVDNPKITGRLDFTSKGFHGMLNMPDGDIVYIDPDKNSGSDLYFSLSKSENISHFKTEFNCQVHDKHSLISQFKKKDLAGKKLAQAPAPALITYRLAIAGTAEFTDSQGGTPSSAYASMITTINRVNEIYQRDLGVKLEIVSGNNLAYTNASTDPYTNNNASAMIGENINNLNNTFGPSNYDIGHVFAQGRLGGLAYVGATCYDDYKAGGTTGIVDPQGEVFAIEFVAHEMGHQLGATHTFNSEKGGCGNGNRSAESAVEPGSGSTIMSYSGLCETDDIQYNSDAMFHWISISQINHYTRVEEGTSCGSRSSTGNQNPVADAGPDSTIPLNTPFLLKGSATGGATYTWDQIDAGSASPVDTDTADNAIIRSLLPSSNQDRYIPRLSDLFSGNKTIGEYLPRTVRSLNFTFVVRDNNGGIDSDLKSISVKDSGGIFRILSQSSDEMFTTGETVDISWATGNTNNAPISCSKVDIQLIRENGVKNMLLANTDNDGGQQLVVADNIPVMTDARVMVNCSNQPFFQISSGNISVQKGANASDTTPPIIQIIGASTINIEKDTNYSDAGATAQDDIDGTVSVSTTGSVNTSVVGTYRITYTATDAAGNTATSIRIIQVTSITDTTPPVITLQGNTVITLHIGQAYQEPGFSALDDIDGVVSVIVGGMVDTSTVGTYTIMYTASDNAGNVVTVTRIVNVVAVVDSIAPVITLQGSLTITLTEGDSYNEPGFSALDNIDGNISVIISGSVNTNVPGTYILTYTATDAAGNSSTRSRTITVQKKNNGTKGEDSSKGGGMGILLLPLALIGLRRRINKETKGGSIPNNIL